MADRVLIDPGVVAISKPGVDVATAAEQDLLFTTDRHKLSIAFIGSIPLVGYVSTPVTLPFGTTLDGVPLCHVFYSEAAGSAWIPFSVLSNTIEFLYSMYQINTSPVKAWQHFLKFEVTSDHFRVSYRLNKVNNSDSPPVSAALNGTLIVVVTKYTV